MDKNKINEMIEAIEVLKDCQIDLDQVIERIRGAVQYTPEESTADAYTLPSLMMISHEEGHGYLGKESGNLDSLMRDLNEIVEEQIALNEEDTPEEVTQKVLKASSEYAQKVIEKSATEIDPSRQVKIHDQPDRVRDVLLLLTADQLTVLRIATRHFDGHPGVDSGTIVYYKPEFLAVALIGSVEDHVQTVDGNGSKGMTSKGLTVTLEILEIFHTAKFPGVTVEDLSHVEMERDDEKGREMAQEVSR